MKRTHPDPALACPPLEGCGGGISRVKKFMLNKIKIIFIVLGGLLILGFAAPSRAAEPVRLYLFYGDGCPHCAKEEEFLPSLKIKFPQLEISSFEVWSNDKNAELMSRVASELKVSRAGVPLTVIGRQAVVGFGEAETTGAEIESLVADAYSVGDYEDVVARVLAGESDFLADQQTNNPESPEADKKIKSIFGEFNLKDLSLPALTVLIGALDSLNPCAMWVLLFLISLLFGLDNRNKMWLLGGTFIFASAAAYFVFLAAWLNIYIFIGYLSWLRLAIALFAVVSGAFYLKKYWVDRKGGCKIEDDARRRKIIERLKEIAGNPRLLFAIIGIAALGVSINLVELLCSAGLPALYVPILTMAGLSKLQYYLYLLLYVFFYILPQLVIFLIAMYSLRVTAISSRVTKYSNLVGGLLMLAIGLLLLFRPGWLAFG